MRGGRGGGAGDEGTAHFSVGVGGFESGEGEDEVRRVTRLEHRENVLRINGRDESAQELLSGQRHVGDGGPVSVNGRSAQGGGVAPQRAVLRQAAAHGETGLQGITSHDGGDIDEDRQVGVAQLDDVQERLLLPRIRNGRAVIKTIHRHRLGSEMLAAGEQGRAEGEDREGDGPEFLWVRDFQCAF